ncbi:MAG: AMP phosphorylase [Candidatus Aenigmatarchaeota archaeon]
MEAKVKTLDVKAGKPVAIINERDAAEHSIFLGDRICLKYKDREGMAIVDTSKEVPRGNIYLFNETKEEIGVEDQKVVEVESSIKPDSVDYIKKKVGGKELNEEETHSIVKDAVGFKLTDSELMAYTVAVDMSDFSLKEAKDLTKAMVNTGEKIDVENALDKHCIGGVPGNRTTPIIVSIIAAAGYRIPKTSSRAITSPAGTADTMEVITDVEHSLQEIENIVEETNGCFCWGGALNLAPADDEFIRVRDSLNLDPLEQLLSSVLAKKKAVGADTVLIDIPMGDGTKVEGHEEANKLSKNFKELGRELDMNVMTLISDGSSPIGKGIGPSLEARDVLKVLESGGEKGPEDLKNKSVKMADLLLDEVGSSRNADEILRTGEAYDKFKEIVDKQGGGITKPENIELAENKHTVKAQKRGRVKGVKNEPVNKIAKAAGCSKQKKSGFYLHKKEGDPVEEGDDLITIYSEDPKRLEKAVELAEERKVYSFKSLLSE